MGVIEQNHFDQIKLLIKRYLKIPWFQHHARTAIFQVTLKLVEVVHSQNQSALLLEVAGPTNNVVKDLDLFSGFVNFQHLIHRYMSCFAFEPGFVDSSYLVEKNNGVGC